MGVNWANRKWDTRPRGPQDQGPYGAARLPWHSWRFWEQWSRAGLHLRTAKAPFYKEYKVWRGAVTVAQKGQRSPLGHTLSQWHKRTQETPSTGALPVGGGPRGCASTSLWEGVSSLIPILSPCTRLIVWRDECKIHLKLPFIVGLPEVICWALHGMFVKNAQQTRVRTATCFFYLKGNGLHVIAEAPCNSVFQLASITLGKMSWNVNVCLMMEHSRPFVFSPKTWSICLLTGNKQDSSLPQKWWLMAGTSTKV